MGVVGIEERRYDMESTLDSRRIISLMSHQYVNVSRWMVAPLASYWTAVYVRFTIRPTLNILAADIAIALHSTFFVESLTPLMI